MEIISKPSPNFGSRKGAPINCIVLHDTGGKTAESTLSWFASENSKVSAHYLIDRDGLVYQCVPDDKQAWHAGVSELWGVKNCNFFSIGIELVDDDDQTPYTELQLHSLIQMCTDLCMKYTIPLNRIVGHEHIALPKGRKADPGIDLNWFELLAAIGSHVADRILGE